MKTCKFSIIIPIYNVENYLEKCLDSVVSQTYKNYECILVVDKSSDKSEEIADKYIKKYNWQKVYEENTGLAKARNLGVDMSNGDYIIFLDGDDYFEKDLLEKLNNQIKNEDLIRYQARDIINDTYVDYPEKNYDLMSGNDAFEKIINFHYVENAWLYAYNSKFYKKNHFKFMENCIAEDYGLIPLVISKSKSIKVISYIGYNYVQRQNSLMNNNNYLKKIKKMDDMLKQYNFEIKNISEDSNPLFKAFLNNSLIYYSTTLKYKDFKKYKKILKEKDCFSHLKGKSLKYKIRNFMIKSNAYFYYNYIMRLR